MISVINFAAQKLMWGFWQANVTCHRFVDLMTTLKGVHWTSSMLELFVFNWSEQLTE